MTSRDFCFWLQGLFEVGRADVLDFDQVKIVRRHLDMVFQHEIDPSMGPESHQAKLSETHSGLVPVRLDRDTKIRC